MNIDTRKGEGMVRVAYCEADECLNPARRSGLCWTHLKRRQKQQEQQERMTPWERVGYAAAAYGMAEEDDEFEAARKRLRRAIEALLISEGWSPPK